MAAGWRVYKAVVGKGLTYKKMWKITDGQTQNQTKNS